MKRTLVVIMVMLGMLTWPFSSLAPANAETKAVKASIKTYEVSVVRSGKKGTTSFSTEKIKLNYWFGQGERTADQPVKKFSFYHFDNDLDLGLHPAPRMQFLLILKGTLQIETTDGERRQFTPGSVFLVTDTAERGSRGHKAKVVGREDILAAVVSVPPSYDFATLFQDH